MLTYNFEKNSKTPLYEQLYSFIREDILAGQLPPHSKLPSKRALAQHLTLSVATVQNAYAQLIAEGYLYTKEKQGHFVSSLETNAPREKGRENSFGEKGEELLPKKEEYFFDLKSNSLSEENFPFSAWAKIMREVISEQGKGLLQPLQYNGVPELRCAISQYLLHFRGMLASPEQIIIGAGSEYLYNLMIQLLGKEVSYGFENPGYEKLHRIFRMNRVAHFPLGMDADGLSCRELRCSPVQAVHISPAHHYPTGIVMPISRRQELLRWAAEQKGRYIIEDDYDSEFRFSGRPIPTLFSIDEQQRVIYLNTFSKSIAPSIRISYMVLPWELLQRFRQEMSFYSCTVPSFEQYTLAKFIRGGGFERHINRMKKTYRQKRDALIEALQASAFAERVCIHEEKAGLHFLLSISTELADAEIARRAAAVGVRLSFLSEYLYGESNSSYQHQLVVNYSGIDLSRLPEAMRRLEEVFLAEKG
ncbi:MAG: PLP-dependent aminotransferase family protein [Firmicutes bacterium]|nr:PLP-dependent aminotransferase family protein [Bacillota bacterium]